MREFLYALGLVAGGLLVFAAGVLLLMYAVRLPFAWAERRGWIAHTGEGSRWGTAGDGLLEVQAIVQPQMKHVLEAKREQREKVEEQHTGGPDKAGDSGSAVD